MNKQASLKTPFSHCKSMGKFSDAQRQLTPVISCPIWMKFELVRDLMHVLLPASLKMIWSEKAKKTWRHCFPYYKSMGAFCWNGNKFWSNLPPNLMQPFPNPSDATLKILSRLANSSSKVWTTMDGWRTDAGSLVYYKLTVWDFDSGELENLY